MTPTLPALGALALLPIALAGCVMVPDAPIVAGNPVAQGTPVALDQPVRVADIVVTPKAVVEDSRCPQNARCVWAGRLVVKTRIDGAGWRETTNVALGETVATHGQALALVSATPEKHTDSETPPGQYRFVYEPR